MQGNAYRAFGHVETVGRFTNAVPIDRNGSDDAALREALDVEELPALAPEAQEEEVPEAA